jgi:hypothetical protein
MEASKLRAFVIGPIGDRDAKDGSSSRSSYEGAIEVFEYVIVPACVGLDIEAYRADHISRTGEINEQIFRNLRDEHIVIADLTDANPNVMYELGLRHTTGKLTIQIGEKGRLPFDISTIRTILFNRTEAGFISAKRSLIAALAEGLEQGSDPVTATRVWFEVPSLPIAIFTSDEDGEGIVEDAPGFLELLADMEVAMVDMAQTGVRGSSILGEITQILQDGTKKMHDLPVGANYSALKLALVNQIAQELHDPSIRLSVVAQDFKNHVERMTPGVEYMLREAANSPDQLSGSPDFLQAVYGLISVSEGSAISSEDFAKSVEQTGTSTRLMRRVTDSIRGSSLSMAQTSRRIAAWKDLADKVSANN